MSNTITGCQLRDSLRKWQYPSDPSTNHNSASDCQHAGTAEWFCRGNKFEEWKATGSLLWIHGKRQLFSFIMMSMALINLLLCSGLRKEYSMVSSFVTLPYQVTYGIGKLRNY